MLFKGGVLLMADKKMKKTIHNATTLSTRHGHKYLRNLATGISRLSTQSRAENVFWHGLGQIS